MLRFYCDLLRGEVPPEALDSNGKYPLCMFPYTRLFSSCRIPGETCDTIETYSAMRHIIVIYRSQMYSIDVINENGTVVSIPELEMLLQQIREDALSQNQPAICALTTENRNKWYKLRKKLLLNEINLSGAFNLK